MKLRSAWRWVLALMFLTHPIGVFGDISLPSLLSSGVVLQRNTAVNLWGQADPGEVITVHTTFTDKKYRITASSAGRWIARLPTPEAGGPYTITLSGANIVTIRDVMIGDVWVCSGQSNIQMPVKPLGGYKGINNWQKELDSMSLPGVRLFNVPLRTASSPLRDSAGQWELSRPQSAATFSAIGALFARDAHLETRVPIGMIQAAWGGTRIQAWMSEPLLRRFQIPVTQSKSPAPHPPAPPPGPNEPAALYNSMISPLLPMTVKGILWYQGESNRYEPELYSKLFPAMIIDWRIRWKLDDMMFLFVQIAPYAYPNDRGETADLRQAQTEALKISNTAMVCTLDIGDAQDIHPQNKQEVARRLWAQAKYLMGESRIAANGPRAVAVHVQDHATVVVEFADTNQRLSVHGDELTGFEIAGQNGKFFPAQAWIQGRKVLLTSPEVTKPACVRYAWSAVPEASLFNQQGLPAEPFSLKVGD